MLEAQAHTEPIPSATTVLLRKGGDGFEVLLVERPKTASFMPGAHVFPGGAVEEADQAPELAEHLDGPPDEELLKALGPSECSDASFARAIYVAALRELFEESGIFLGRRPSKALPQEGGFFTLLKRAGWRPDLKRLLPLARWITPAVERRRYDARFFLALIDEEEAKDLCPSEESQGALWLSPARACALYRAGAITLPPPTLRTLEHLARFESAEAAIEATRLHPPPLVCPLFHQSPAGPILALPGDPLHPESKPAFPGPTRLVLKDGRWSSESPPL
ncbi:MAG: hypothetical protein NZM37_05130 [Sandaracinaceae bacterium]|nr:hypothetical protein [Sandaracinaceae bacterium]MDW8245152.1 hypothetical protein [Sandaracinaceae bacterium]